MKKNSNAFMKEKKEKPCVDIAGCGFVLGSHNVATAEVNRYELCDVAYYLGNRLYYNDGDVCEPMGLIDSSRQRVGKFS